ncbi:hypothetical protein EJB05_36187, partial [Eragrostis curvula]
MFAAGVTDVVPLVKINGVAQCTGDLGSDDCYSCLDRASAYIPSYWDMKQGGQFVLWSCFVRFEASLFYNVSAAEAAMSTAPAPDRPTTASTPAKEAPTDAAIGVGSNRTVRTALFVSVPAAVTLLVLLFVAVYICKKNRKLHKIVQIASNSHVDEEMGSSDSLQYDLNTLRAATDNFSEQNKLEQGGFGPVYKGTLQNEQIIAVKRLSTTSQQRQAEMKNEVWRNWREGNVPQLVDGCPADEHGKEEMLRCIHIGLLCVQDDAQLRPGMAAVVHMLKSRPVTLASPTEPLFEVPGERPRVAALELSINEASISHLEPR